MIYIVRYRLTCDCWRETAPLADVTAVCAKIGELVRMGASAVEVGGIRA